MIIAGSRMVINHQALARFQMKQMWEHYGNMVIMLISYVEMQSSYSNYPIVKEEATLLDKSSPWLLQALLSGNSSGSACRTSFSSYVLSLVLFFLLSVYINPQILEGIDLNSFY